MEENRSNLENIFDNLYIRAEKAGTVKFDKEEDRQAAKTELMNLYQKYFALLSSRSSAVEKTRTQIKQGDSREEKKHAKQKIKQGKKEVKEFNKQIEIIQKQINAKLIIFDLPSIGGKRQAEMMIQSAYREDIDEEARNAIRQQRAKKLAGVCPQVEINEGKAFETAEKTASEKPLIENVKGE